MNKDAERRPIGYWLKSTHDALEESMNRLLNVHSLNRQHWQILNSIREASPALSKSRLFDTMKTFTDTHGLTVLLNDLQSRGWVEMQDADDAVLRLTDEGVTAHQTLLTEIKHMRARSMNGIEPQDYQTVIAVLERMINNLT